MRAAALLLVLLASCGPDTRESASLTPERTRLAASDPVGVADAFLGAARDGDARRFESLLTERARDGLQEGEGGFDLSGKVASYELGTARIDGDAAEVPVLAVIEGEAQSLDLRMRHDGGAWRVYGFRVELEDGRSLAIDLEQLGAMLAQMQSAMQSAFEQSFEYMRRGGSPEQIRAARERFDALVPIGQAEHDAAWRIDLSADGRPASAVLEEILVGTGIGVDPTGSEAALARPVELALEGVSRLEAIERTCRQVGLIPIHPPASDTASELAVALAEGVGSIVGADGRGGLPGGAAGGEPRIGFEQGARPVAFAGPFLVEVLDLEQNPPNATGTLTLGVRSLGLAPAVLAFQTEMVETLAVDSIVDPRGASLMEDEATTHLSVPEVGAAQLVSQTSLDLRNLLAAASELTLRGRVELVLPTTIRSLSWRAGEAGERIAGDLSVKSAAWGESTRFEIEGGERELADLQVRYGAHDARGEPLGILWSDWTAWGDAFETGLQTHEPPGQVDIKLCTGTALEYPFVLEGVRLDRCREQPEALAALAFEGAAPLAVEFVRFVGRDEDFPEVELAIRSFANKDAREASVEFVYLDGGGTELESFPHTLAGELGMQGTAALVAAGAATTQATVAHFMPPGTSRVAVRVARVEFADASVWETPR